MNTIKLLWGVLALLLSHSLTAQNPVVSATINPAEFYYNSQTNEDPFTVITCNDATEVTSIIGDFWGYPLELEENVDYVITQSDATTSRLTFLDEKLKGGSKSSIKDSEFDLIFTINFNIGNSSIFKVISEVEVTYSVIFWISDNQGNEIIDATLTFNETTFEPGEDFVGMYPPGIYDYIVSKEGYQSVAGSVTVESAVSESVVLYPTNMSEITFRVLSSGDFIANASVEIDNTTLVTNNQGIATIQLAEGNYTYRVTAEGCHVTTSTVEIPASENEIVVEMQTISNIANISSLATTVYPNPTSSILNIKSDFGAQTTIQILSMVGKIEYQTTINEKVTLIDVQHLENGLYFIVLKNKQSSEYFRFIKN